MIIHSDGSNKKASVPEVADAGRAMLAAYSFQRTGNRHQREDYELGVKADRAAAASGFARRSCQPQRIRL